MRLKKINAALALLTAAALLAHVGATVYIYLTMTYNPGLKTITSVPFMVCVCLHAILGMAIVFTQADGTRADLYPKQNRRTIAQRISAALIFPLLILHLNTFSLLKDAAAAGNRFLTVLLLISHPLFFGAVFIHTAESLTRALITLGWLTDRKKQKTTDMIIRIFFAAVLAVSVYAVVKGQAAMFLAAGGTP